MSDALIPEVAALIVGAGPVGLTLACELLSHGYRCQPADGIKLMACLGRIFT
jgi:hypothetical protein